MFDVDIVPLLLEDGYKEGHVDQYPRKTTKVYSNRTPRGSRLKGIDYVIPFGQQYFNQNYLKANFNRHFFERPRHEVLNKIERRIKNYIGRARIDHIANLHELGYLPLRIKSLPEGMKIPLRIPTATITNTHPEFFWLPNKIETLMENVQWLPTNSATIAFDYRQALHKAALRTGGSTEFVKWQGHDFSMRGMAGIEAACLSGAAHLLSFTGSDTVPAIDFLERFYHADSDKELVAGTVFATEHSVMCAGQRGNEFNTYVYLLTDVYPTGIVSIVSDTWDLWQVVTDYMVRLRDIILSRDGKLVIRPDSGDPVKILCGDPDGKTEPERKGVIECLWDVFGGTVNLAGYKELDPHIGAIYGDSITRERRDEIVERLAAKGFASTNVVLGIGSFTYQYNTRDTFGQAMKSTYVEIDFEGFAISKSPVTDAAVGGVKKSASGLLKVVPDGVSVKLVENCSEMDEASDEHDLLCTTFVDGWVDSSATLAGMRRRIESYL